MNGKGELTIGQLTAFLFYLGLLYTPIIRVVDSNAIVQQAATALEKNLCPPRYQAAYPGE